MSFDDIYREHYRELKRFCRRLNHSAEKSEDLVQDTYMKLYLELNRNKTINNPRAWLYKVLLNSFRTNYTSEKKELEIRESISGGNAPAYDIHQGIFAEEEHKIVMKVLDTLPDDVREILLLYDSGFSYAEMAEIMEIKPSSVGTTLVRAINKLKEILKLNYNEMFEQN